jgi:tetratricopeptide (TPR) repeat protein
VELEAGRPHEALDALRHGRELSRGIGSGREQAYFDLEEARALAQLGELDDAAALAMSAAAAFEAEGHPLDLGRTFAVIARAFHERGDSARAQELYELAVETLEREPNVYISQVYADFGELLEDQGRNDEALAVYKRAARASAALSRVQAG